MLTCPSPLPVHPHLCTSPHVPPLPRVLGSCHPPPLCTIREHWKAHERYAPPFPSSPPLLMRIDNERGAPPPSPFVPRPRLHPTVYGDALPNPLPPLPLPPPLSHAPPFTLRRVQGGSKGQGGTCTNRGGARVQMGGGVCEQEGGLCKWEGGRTSDRAGRSGGARMGGGEHAHPPSCSCTCTLGRARGHAQMCPCLFCPSLSLLPPSPTCMQERHTTSGSAGADNNGRGCTNRKGGHVCTPPVHVRLFCPPPSSFPHLRARVMHNEGQRGGGQQWEEMHEWEGGHARTPFLPCSPSLPPSLPHLCAGATQRGASWGWTTAGGGA